MRYEEFIFRVQERSGLETAEEARQVSQAAMTVLGECLTGEEAGDLASQLPAGLEEYLVREEGSERAAGLSLEEFYQRVARRAGIKSGEAETRSWAVAKALEEAVSEGEIQDLRSLLPDELERLFER